MTTKFETLIKRARREAKGLARWKKIVLMQMENQTRTLAGKPPKYSEEALRSVKPC